MYDRYRAYAGCYKGKVTRKSNTREIKQNTTAVKVGLCFEVLHKEANKNFSCKAVGLEHQNNS